MSRCAVGGVSPVASTIAVNDRSPVLDGVEDRDGAIEDADGPLRAGTAALAERPADHRAHPRPWWVCYHPLFHTVGTSFQYMEVGRPERAGLARNGTPVPEPPRTIAEKVWEQHVVHRADGEPDLLYVDLHLVHEVTSAQAFDGLRAAGRAVRRPDLTVATMDHNVPTTAGPVTDEISAKQMEALKTNARGVRGHALPVGCAGAGDRPRDRPRDGLHAAGARDRLRRLAHVDPRRLRRPRVRDRHQRGRARARHPDAPAGQTGVDGRDRRRRPPRELQRQGRHPGDHQPDRHRRRLRQGRSSTAGRRSGRSPWRGD